MRVPSFSDGIAPGREMREELEHGLRLPGIGKAGTWVAGSNCLLRARQREIRGFLAQVLKTDRDKSPKHMCLPSPSPFADR